MELTEEQVTHVTFGAGTVKSVEDGRITVNFAENIGEKAFQYPTAFERYLRMSDPTVQDLVIRELNGFLLKAASEKARKERLHHEEQDRQRAEELALAKAAKKPAKKKVVAKAADGSDEKPVKAAKTAKPLKAAKPTKPAKVLTAVPAMNATPAVKAINVTRVAKAAKIAAPDPVAVADESDALTHKTIAAEPAHGDA